MTFIVAFLALAVLIFFTGQYARWNLARTFPAPGKMIAVAQHKLHVNCQGQGSVVVILEAGLNDFSIHWHRLQPLLSQHTITCSYDRAGLGWSEPSENQSTLRNKVNDLRDVVQAVGSGQPLILVGHSFGSMITRLYAQQYPENVRALILVDPANEHMAERIPGYQEAIESAATQFKGLQPIASLGLMALAKNSIPADVLEGEALAQYRAVLASGSFFRGAFGESNAMLDNLEAMQQIKSELSPTIPVVIISRAKTSSKIDNLQKEILDQDGVWEELQQDLVRRLNATHIHSAQSEHRIQVSEPDLLYRKILPFIEDFPHQNEH